MSRVNHGLGKRTEDDDVQNQNDEPEDTATGAVLPAVSGGRGRNVTNGRAESESRQAELEKEVQDDVEHLD